MNCSCFLLGHGCFGFGFGVDGLRLGLCGRSEVLRCGCAVLRRLGIWRMLLTGFDRLLRC